MCPLLVLIISLLQWFFLDPIICYYWKGWPPVPCERASAYARLLHWDSTIKCQAWQAVFPVLPECTNPALKAHRKWPVNMLLLRGLGSNSAGGWRLGPAATAQRNAAAVAQGRWRWRWQRWLQRRAAGTSSNSSASLSTADLPACNCWENVLNIHDCY